MGNLNFKHYCDIIITEDVLLKERKYYEFFFLEKLITEKEVLYGIFTFPKLWLWYFSYRKYHRMLRLTSMSVISNTFHIEKIQVWILCIKILQVILWTLKKTQLIIFVKKNITLIIVIQKKYRYRFHLWYLCLLSTQKIYKC